ncbi:MAG: pentapeptide repeat-containing protein [Thermodesulfobacteriota bacterium]|nr:pentapeptide repeat-containing protein [Thermodesulfobacteriota bacterium]
MKNPGLWQRVWNRTGLADKTLWDLLQLLIVPLLVVVVANHLNEAANERQRLETADRHRQEVYNRILSDMSDLILEGGLAEPEAKHSVRAVARARILTTLQEIDPARKRSLITFLAQSKLIDGMYPVIALNDADLRGVDLSGLYLWGENLVGADLREANLQDATLAKAFLMGGDLRDADMRGTRLLHARLTHARLEDADLRGANLIDADLENTRLTGAKLKGALYSEKTRFPSGFDPGRHAALTIAPGSDLRNARLQEAFLRNVNLSKANLTGANLESAQLQHTDLRGADLSGANLRGAYLNEADLTGARLEGSDLCGATMPDGSINTRDCRQETLP